MKKLETKKPSRGPIKRPEKKPRKPQPETALRKRTDTDGIFPMGAPQDEERETVVLTFRADADTMDAVDRLTAIVAEDPGVMYPRSVAIRRALLEAAASAKKGADK